MKNIKFRTEEKASEPGNLTIAGLILQRAKIDLRGKGQTLVHTQQLMTKKTYLVTGAASVDSINYFEKGFPLK